MPDYIWAPNGKERIYFPGIQNDREHFATRVKRDHFIELLNALPDPDPILKKQGKDITILRELLTDGHLEANWSTRLSAVSGTPYTLSPGGKGKQETKAYDLVKELLSHIEVTTVMEEMMEAVAYGYSPIEIIWLTDGTYWIFDGLVGKPAEWFTFNQENRFVFKKNFLDYEDIPENRFLLVQHRASYNNPYGQKAFSKCFWPVTFKRNGFRWWTVFVEKYGGAFLSGKYPPSANDEYKNELLNALERMVADAVAIFPEDSEIDIEESASKSSSSTVYEEYIRAANAEISKATLGQTLTTEISSKASYAAAKEHTKVREDLAKGDKRRISAAFNRLFDILTLYNFGEDTAHPLFEFVEKEDLQLDRLERDKKLFGLNVRFKKSYFSDTYNIPEDRIEVLETVQVPAPGLNSLQTPFSESKTSKKGWLKRFFEKAKLSREDKRIVKDNELLDEFSQQMEEEAQEEVNGIIEAISGWLESIETFEDAYEAVVKLYPDLGFEELTVKANNILYASSQIGAASG